MNGPLRNAIFSLKPHEAIGDVFDYFGFVLSNAPKEKVKEFFENFESGVREAIVEYRKEVDQ
jgi:hypothetical protein